MRRITGNFFFVRIDSTVKKTFIEIVDEIWQHNSTAEKRMQPIPEGYNRLADWTVKIEPGYGRVAWGNLQRIRTDQSARMSQRDKDDVLDLALPPGFHLTELFTFLFFEETGTIIVHRNWYAGGHTRLSDYINMKYSELHRLPDGSGAVDFETPISTKGLERFQEMGDIYKTEITVAVPKSAHLYEDASGDAVNEVVKMAADVGAAEFTIRFSKGRRKQPLLQRIKSLVSGIVEQGQDNIRSAKAIGRANSISEEITVDLIEERIHERVSVPVHATLNDYYDALRFAYQQRRREILALSADYGATPP
jgi:hypothetical protein